jgi:hypothetical protein
LKNGQRTAPASNRLAWRVINSFVTDLEFFRTLASVTGLTARRREELYRRWEGQFTMGAHSMEQALAEEAEKLASPTLQPFARNLRRITEKQANESAQSYRNADAHHGDETSSDEVQRRKEFYRSLNQLNRSALCLSGGGIRSATFCLGVIQVLAVFGGYIGSWLFAWRSRDDFRKVRNELIGRSTRTPGCGARRGCASSTPQSSRELIVSAIYMIAEKAPM